MVTARVWQRKKRGASLLIVLACLVGSLLLAASAWAQNDNNNSFDENMRGCGLVLDHTLSKNGHDFYSYFCSKWSAPEDAEVPTIIIKERVDPQWGSLVWVEVDYRVIYKAMVSGRLVRVDEQAESGVNALENYLVQTKLREMFIPETDMVGDGMTVK